MAGWGLLCALAGPVMVAGGDPAGWGAAGMGVACLVVLPVCWPWSVRASTAVATPDGLAFPQSRLRGVAAVVGAFGFVLLGLALFRTQTGFNRWAGAVCAVTFGVAALAAPFALLRGVPRLLLAPDGVRFGAPGREAFLAWEHVAAVRGTQVSTRGSHTAFLSFFADDPAHVVADTGPVTRRLRRLGRPWGSIAVPADHLATNPVAAYWAARFYAEHPEVRAELADGRAAHRVRRGDLR